MDGLRSFLRWFSGGAFQYHDLIHCMRHDIPWIAMTVALDIAVAIGYVVIAMHWYANQRYLPEVPAKQALRNIRNIFIFCGICGYAFIPIKMFWPAWRLYDMFMFVLVYFTWKYAWNAKDLKVVYTELGRSTRLAEDLHKSQEESQRKSFFLNALSHDLRTPLNGLILQANLAEISAKNNDPAALKAALDDIKSSTLATSDLLDSLLEYARLDRSPEEVSATTFDLSALLRELVSRFQGAASAKGIALKTHLPKELSIDTDRMKLDRIVGNLLSNAIKFTQQGTVRIETEDLGGEIEIHVIDTGVGIEASHQTRLFEEFFQVANDERDPRKGFGLGLAIARRLARQLGGEISVTSAVGNGSRFSVVLPRSASPAAEHVRESQQPDAAVAIH